MSLVARKNGFLLLKYNIIFPKFFTVTKKKLNFHLTYSIALIKQTSPKNHTFDINNLVT